MAPLSDLAFDRADLPAGYRFGNYVILERIGRGGMAQVYRAEHVALNKRVALKVMDHALHDKATAHRQFLREGRTAAAVKHPNVVDITDVGVWQGVPFLVMELLEGWDLETHLRERGPLPDGELVRLALPVIAGLAAAHDSGVIHRDLKPSNIFLARGADGEQVPKVLDFGISKLAREAPDLTATPYGTLMGTPLYLPPEAVGGAHAFSAASDQYSLGVVLYECAVGRPPFEQDTLVSLLQRITSGEFAAPSRSRPDLSAVIDRAIVRAMAPDPRQRFAHVRDLGRALWEVASPRTQVLWGRAFGELGPSSLPPSSVRGSTLALRPSEQPPHAASTRHEFVRPLGLATGRNLRLWLLVAALLSVGAVAVAALLRQGGGPRGESLSSLPQPGEASVSASALLPSTPAVPVSAPPPLAPAPAASPAPIDGAPLPEPPPAATDARPARARSAPVRERVRPRGVAAPPERAAAAALVQRRELATGGVSAASDGEFPGLPAPSPESSAGRAGERTKGPRGANESPILD